MSGNERDLNVSVPTGEEIPRPDSSASSVISRTSSPEHIEDDVFVAKQEDKTADPRKVSADVAARGIVSPKKFSGPVPQSGMRGMLIAACEIENGQETDEVSLQIKNEQLNKDTGTAPEQDFATSQEINFFNKDSSISRPSSASSTSSVAEETNRREVSFQASNEDHLLKKERSFISHSGNTTVEVVSICTQTEWSWLKDIELYQEVISRSKPEWAERTERKVSKEAPKSPSGNSHAGSIKRRKKKSVGSRRTSVSSEKAAQIKDEENSSLPELEEGNEAKPSSAGLEEGSTGRSKSKSSGGVPRSRQSVVSSLPRTPKGEDILFRPATVEPESCSSSDYDDYELEQEYLLPSIGPPAILQYLKESQHPPMSNEEVEDRRELAKSEMLKKSMSSGPCMFCQEEVLPFPTVEELERLTPDQLYCCPQYERFIKFELAQRTDTAHLVDEMIDIKPHPPYGTKAARRAAKERAAERAREREMERQRAAGANPTNFYALTRQMKTITYSLASTKCMEEGWTVRPESPSSMDTEQFHDPFVIEVNPLQLRKQAFLERFYNNGQRFLLLLPDGTGTCYYPSGNIAVMITATEKGKFTYIVFDDDEDNDANPSRMLAIFEPSGHGTCYYRDGSVRLVLNPFFGVLLDSRGARKKKWLWHNLKEHVHAPPFQPITFMITKQLSIRCLSQNKTVLTFNHGKHTARFNVGSKLKAVAKVKTPTGRDSYETHLAEVKQFVKLVLNPFFGVLLDSRRARKKKWLWHNLKEHVHAPPFQPITFMITKQLSIRCLSQNKTVLTFNHGKHTARFNVGSKLKAVAKVKTPTGRDSYETHLAEVKQFVNIVLDRYQNAMRLPNYPRLDKIPLPLHLQRAKDAGNKARLQGSAPSSQRETTVIVN